MTNTQSLHFRQSGNDIYRTISKELAPILKENRLLKSGEFYLKAINSADNHIDSSSAFKNYSSVAFDLFNFYTKKHQNRLAHHYATLFQEYSQKALEAGKGIQVVEWFNKLLAKQLDAAEIYFNDFILCEIDKENERIDLLVSFKEKSSKNVECVINYKIADLYHKSSIKNMDSNLNYSYRAINECNYYLEECLYHLNRNKLKLDDTTHELIENRIIQECIIEAKLSKLKADKQIEGSLHDEETLHIDLVWDSIDTYHEAICKSKDKDLELEAEICSKLGIIYIKVLKMNDRAKNYFNMCFNLAESLKPKIFNDFAWYKRCLNAIEKFQKDVVENEKKEEEKEKTKVMNEIKDDLEKIKIESEKGDTRNFIEFVYKNYPPKNNQKCPENLNGLAYKAFTKVSKKSLIDYHEDKNLAITYGYPWFFIVQEISKYLGRIYENLKQLD